MKIISWNVNGIRAVAKKDFFKDFKKMDADILCLQETKAQDSQVLEVLEPLKAYHIYSNSALRPGYSGTAVISKTKALNVAHKAIDLARPKPNYNKSAGFKQEEIDGMDRYTQSGLVDTFRHFFPDEPERYSWWSYSAGARAKNVGWRIDYILASESTLASIDIAFIINEVMGSDHCPVGIELGENFNS